MRPDRILGRSYETLSFGLAAARHLARAGARLAARLRGPRTRRGPPSTSSGSSRRRSAAPASHPRARRRPGAGWAARPLRPRRARRLGRAGRRRPASPRRRWDDAQQLVALLAAATGARPTKAWRRRSARARGVVRRLRRAAARAARAAALDRARLLGRSVAAGVARRAGERDPRARRGLGTADVDEPWVVPLLGRLALRCAAPSPHPKVTTALCHPAASGAIEALAAIGDSRGARRAPHAARRGAAPRPGQADRGGARRAAGRDARARRSTAPREAPAACS